MTNVPPTDEQGLVKERPLDGVELDSPPASPEEIALATTARIEANFELATSLRENAIAVGAITRDQADNFSLIEVAPKASDIESSLKDVAAEIVAKTSADEDTSALKQTYAKLTMEYAYNTLAMLQTSSITGLINDLSEIVGNLNGESDRADEAQIEIDKKLGLFGQIAAGLEGFERNSNQLMKDFRRDFPALQPDCDRLNRQYLLCTEQTDNLKINSDESWNELSRFIEEFKQDVSVERIQKMRESLKGIVTKHQQEQVATADGDNGGNGNTPDQTEVREEVREAVEHSTDDANQTTDPTDA